MRIKQTVMSSGMVRARVVDRYKTWGALAGLSVSMLLSALGTSIANVALPTLTDVFHVSFGQVQWVVLSYLLVVTALIVSIGRLGDMFGRKRLLLAGLFLFIVGSIISGVAGTFWQLIAGRIVQGAGGAAMMALTMALVSEVLPESRTGTAMGMLGMMSAVGTALGPSLGGVLITEFGWSYIFLCNIPIGIFGVFLVHWFLPESRERKRVKKVQFDWAGTCILAATLVIYALSMTINQKQMGLLNGYLLLLAVGGTALFVWFEKNTATPLVDVTVFRNRRLAEGVLMNGLVAAVMMTTLVVGPFYLAKGLGLDAEFVGLVMSIGPCVVALTGVLFGRMTDRLGTESMTFAGLSFITAGAGLLAGLPLSGQAVALEVAGYVISMVVLTLGYSMFQTANNTAVMKNVAKESRGVVSGVVNLSRNLGFITGASVMGALFAVAVGSGSVVEAGSAAVTEGMKTAFAVASASIGGIVLYRVVQFVRAKFPREEV